MGEAPSASKQGNGPLGTQTPVEQDASGSKHGTLATLGRLVLNKWTGGILLAILVLAWLAGMPRGELRLALFPDVAADPEKIRLATALFQRADAALSDAEGHHRQLSGAVGDGPYDVSIPPPTAPGETGLQQFVSDLSFDGSVGHGISAKVNALSILQKSYEWVGLHDYFVVIRGVEPVSCPSDPDDQCWRVIAQYWPSLMRPDEFIGPEDELARDLAVLVLRGVVRNKGDEWRRAAAPEAAPPFLLAPAMPSTMAALEATAKGLEMLTLGESHPACIGKSELECIELARSKFAFSIEHENTLNPVAAYGHALIELDAALRAAREADSELTVESGLSKAEVWTTRARQSEFLRSAMERADLGLGFKLLSLEGLAPGSTLIELARRFACALADYRRANWQGCVAEVGNIEDFPRSLQPYVEAALLDASLTEATNADDFGMRFEALKQRLSAPGDEDLKDAEHLLRQVMLKHACARTDTLDDEGFAALVRVTTDNAPHQGARQEAMILAAACRPGQNFPSEANLEQLAADVAAMEDSRKRHRFELLLSQYRIRRGELDAALALASKALPLPWTGAYVRKAREFAPMIESSDHGPVFIDASFTTTALSDLESCPRFE